MRTCGFSILRLAAFLVSLTCVVSANANGGGGGNIAVEKAEVRIDSAPQEKEVTEETSPGETNSVSPFPSAANAASYSFNTTTTASLINMSSGTTKLIGPNQDDVISFVTPIGFDFYFQGVRQDRFTVNSNGTLRFGATAVSTTLYDPLAQTGQFLVTPYGADQRTHAGDGKVHFKVIGTAPNRELVIEWLNMQANFNSGGTADLTYQLHLFETSGVIEFAYGSMTMSAAGAADANSQSPQFGFSSDNTVGNVGSITAAQSGAPAPTFSGAAAVPVNNLYVTGPITVLTSVADGSRRSFVLTPPVPTAPTGPLTFTSITASGMTLNWGDSPDEQSYAIYGSTDNVTYTFFGTAVQNATSFVATGLVGSTTYFWRVFSVSEGTLSALSGTQATAAATANTSMSSGLWSSPATWSTNVVPTINDAVTIAAGTTVTIDIAAVAQSVSVASGGVLQFEQTTARTLAVGADVTVQNGGTFQSNPAGAQTGHVLSVTGNLINNGTLEFSTNTNTAGAGITFAGATNNSFSGTGATTDVRSITINKGTGVGFANVLELQTNNFTVQGVSTDVAGFLTLTNGILKLSGSFVGTNRVFNGAAAYTIPAAGGFWLNNPNYTVAGQGASPTNSGVLHVSQGTYNIGTATGNALGFSTFSVIIVDGGAINAAGRFGVAAAANVIAYTQSAGTITVCTAGNTSALASFDLGTSLNSNISVNGGTIINQLASTAGTPLDYRNQSGSGFSDVAGATVQLGNAASGAAKTFTLLGVLPNVVITNTSANHTANMSTAAVNFNNISRNVTVNSGATFNIGNTTFLMGGATFTNDGTLTANGASSNFVWFDIGAGPQTYTGGGITTSAITNFSVQTSGTLTLSSTNQVITNRINLFVGGIVNSNKLTLGDGAATVRIIQIGNTTTPTAAGIFDFAPTFNLGAGQTISYLRTGSSRTTGPEINPTRTLVNFTFDDNDVTHTLTQAGGDLSVTGTTALTNGRLITGANTFSIGAAGTVTRTNGYVDGNLKKTFAAAASKTFEIGSANGYTPAVVNATAGTFPSDVTLNAVQSSAPGFTPVGKSINRYWNVTAPAITAADLTFNYLDPADLPGTITEANLVMYRLDGATYTNLGGTENTAANNLQQTGITTFGLFTLGEPVIVDLAITKDDGVTTATPAGSVTYTIVASNAGPSTATGATVADTFPAIQTCNWTCSGAGGGTCTASGSGNINDLVNLPSGGSVTYMATCTISGLATGSMSNTATIAVPSGVIDTVPGNNSATDTDTINPSADLSVTKTDGVTTATAGGSVTYTITASNAGPSNAPGSTVADTFPASETCSWTCTGAAGGTCTALGSGNINDAINLPSGGSATYTASCSISASTSGTLSNTATVTAAVGITDPVPGNNSATDSDTVTGTADLTITKTDGVTTATPGGSVTYTITASNPVGPSDTTGATVADTFPASLTCTWTCSGAGGGTCTVSGSGNINDLVNLPLGGSSTYTASCTISGSATGTLSNTATVTVPAGVTDPTPGNNSATDSDTLNPSADLSITKTDGATTAAPGGSLTYTIVASNAGPSDVTGATVADTFPAAETCSWTCSGAGGGTCAASGSGNISDLVNLPSGASATYVASCSVSLSATGTLSNTATVTAPGSVTDPTPGNNSATDNDTVSAVANLTVTVDDGHGYARYGMLLNYLVKVSNAGPSNATGISIVETTSNDFSDATAHWTCIGGDAGASCTPSGTGLLSDSNVTIPVGRSLTWLVSISLLANPPDDFADNTFTVNAAADTASPHVVLDSDTFVTFRDGFEPGLQDGTGAVAMPIAGAGPLVLSALGNPLAFGQSLTFTMPDVAGSSPVDTLVQANAVDGSGFRVERLNLGTTPSVRVVSIDMLGMERASTWAQTANLGQVVVGLIGDQGTNAVLETTGGEATLQLNAQVHEVYQVRAVGTASITH